jgi:hypothetical protein
MSTTRATEPIYKVLRCAMREFVIRRDSPLECGLSVGSNSGDDLFIKYNT